VEVAAQLDQAQLLHRQSLVTELFFDQCDGAPHAPSRHVVLGQILNGPHRNQVAETIKPLTPSRLRTDQPQPFPVTKTARLQPQDAANFTSRIALRQAEKPPSLVVSDKRLCTCCQLLAMVPGCG
jgi:hypothetical protein